MSDGVNVENRSLGYEVDGPCCEFEGPKDGHGYGYVAVNPGNYWKAHRLAWMAYNCQQIPDGMEIMHLCDNPLCINPRHLRLGTHKDNLRDAARKGRFDGECGSQAKLTSDEVLQIRKSYRENDVSQRELADQYDVNQSHISRIINKKNWVHV